MSKHKDLLFSSSLMKEFESLDLEDDTRIQAEYVWLGGNGGDLRCKTKTLPKPVGSIEELPEWSYDGSSTNQAEGNFSEIIIRPRAMFKDPFRPNGKNILVLCDTYNPDGTPHETNTRYPANELFNQKLDEEPWFGIEQEYTLLNKDVDVPVGWPKGGFPGAQGPYYCGVGAENAFGRAINEAHYKCCLYAGLKIAGCNAEVMPGQWEYQIGPCTGIESGDHMWMSRYILNRVGERFNTRISFDPKPIDGDWNGAGCHTNFSTKTMRAEGGIKEIYECVKKLEAKHKEHIAVYGEGNDRRLTGDHETASMTEFSFGVGDRGASVRIPIGTERDGKGYLEDRRPASNIDAYIVTAKIFETTFDLAK